MRLFRRLKLEVKETLLLLRNVPAVMVTLFIVSVIAMNILAEYSIIPEDSVLAGKLALDGGIFVSWLSFLGMDTIVKRFGAKASIRISVFATFVNLTIFLIKGLVMYIALCANPKSVSYTCDDCVTSLWVLGASTIAFVVSAVINSLVNEGLGCMFKNNPNSKSAYIVRTYISTMLGQFLDNLIFAFLFSFFFFRIRGWEGWTPLACVTCALTGAIVELLWEVVFSPIGYKTCKKWEENKVGVDYLMVEEEMEKEKIKYKADMNRYKELWRAMSVSSGSYKSYLKDKAKVKDTYLDTIEEILNYKWKLGAREI